jgi:hypothetical protein
MAAQVIRMDEWRERRAGAGGPAADPDGPAAGAGRLQRAVERLDLVLGERGPERLQADVERDLLTVVGELALGYMEDAARRAEQLADRLVAGGK